MRERGKVLVLTEPFLTAFTLGLTSGICCLLTNAILQWVLRHIRNEVRVRRLRSLPPKARVRLSLGTEDNEGILDRVREGVCPICLGELLDVDEAADEADLLDPPCGHTLHNKCLRSWLSAGQVDVTGRSACPICRGPANVSDCVQICVRRCCYQVAQVEAADEDAVVPVSVTVVAATPPSRHSSSRSGSSGASSIRGSSPSGSDGCDVVPMSPLPAAGACIAAAAWRQGGGNVAWAAAAADPSPALVAATAAAAVRLAARASTLGVAAEAPPAAALAAAPSAATASVAAMAAARTSPRTATVPTASRGEPLFWSAMPCMPGAVAEEELILSRG